MQITVLAVIFVLKHHEKSGINKKTIIASAFALLYSATFAIWTSDIGIALSILGLLASNTFLILFAWGHHGIFNHPFSIVVDLMRYGIQTTLTRLGILGDITLPRTNKNTTAIIRGLIIAIPIIIIFFLLFLSSDLMLEAKTQVIQIWLSDTFGQYNLIVHAFIIGFFAFVFLITLASMFWKKLDISPPSTKDSHSRIESLVILGLSNILFLSFLAFQGFYLFGGQEAFDSLGELTYSQYAVSGFNELAVVAILVLLLILTLRHFHNSNNSSKWLKITEIGLLAQTVTLLASAWLRLSMYVGEYGYTPSRLFGFWFFTLCVVLIATLVIHIIKSIDQHKYTSQALVITGCAMLLFTAIAPDALTVRLNIIRAQETGELDAFPLFNELSAEAYPLMDMVLSNELYQEMIGIMDTEITDYCAFIVTVFDSTNPYSYFLVNSLGDDENISLDLEVRQDRALFYFDWHAEGSSFQINQNDWRTWNLANALVPVKTISNNADPIQDMPYPIEDIVNACGM